MDPVTLVVPPGAQDYPISHGTESFAPYREDHTKRSRWLVDVPPEVAQHLIGVGGFIMAEKAAAEQRKPVAIVRMFHPDGGTSDAYDVEDGFIMVPNGPDIAIMRAHGFKVDGEVEVAPALPSMVPAANHQRALDHIASLEQTVKEQQRDANMMRDQLDAKDGEIAKLHADIEALTAPRA